MDPVHYYSISFINGILLYTSVWNEALDKTYLIIVPDTPILKVLKFLVLNDHGIPLLKQVFKMRLINIKKKLNILRFNNFEKHDGLIICMISDYK